MRILNVLTFIAYIAASYGATIPDDASKPSNAVTDIPQKQESNGAPPEDMGPKKIELDLKAGPITCNYGEFDTNANLDSNNKINCNGNTCNITGNGVTATQGLITISAAGDYILEGDFQGQVLIQAQKKDDVHLILNNSSISSNNGPAINALEADKVVLTLSGNNKIVDSLNYTGNEKDPDACIFSKTDLTINGDGNLEVTGVYADAIRSTKDIKLVSGNINVNAKGKGIKGKNSICIKDATININSTDSALKVTSQENKNKGYLVIDNGKLTISTENDALHAETHFTNHNGNIDIKACKEGIEAQMVDILGGEIHIKATDDGINAAQVGKAGEEMPPPPPPGDVFDPSQPPPPKPFDPHANDGSIYVNIVGGKVYVDVTEEDCDGIDTNGIAYIGGDAQVFISVNGGEIYGPISTIDAEGDNSIVAGATFVGTAGDFDWNLMMPPNMRNNNKEKNNKEKKVKRGEQTDKAKVYQPKVLMEIPMQKAGTELTLKDKSNNTIVSFTPGNDYSHVLITSPKIVAGETYNLISGNGNNTQSIVAAKADEGSPKPPSVTSSSGSLSSISLSMATLVIAMIVALLQF